MHHLYRPVALPRPLKIDHRQGRSDAGRRQTLQYTWYEPAIGARYC